MTKTNNKVKPQVLTTKKILDMPLIIPEYQRPYKWQTHHVNQLFNDLLGHQTKGRYRLGTLVLNTENPKSEKEVVDGQQRLVTLSLLCRVLDPEQKSCKPSLFEKPFNSAVSHQNLRRNYALIQERSSQLNNEDKASLLSFVLNSCELVVVTLDNISEAFQFFDSQNARGKPLEPYDLLKAFHLRAFDERKLDLQKQYVTNWEQAATTAASRSDSLLAKVMSDHLFRLRRWAEGDSGFVFTRHNIATFKGVDAKHSRFPSHEPYRTLDWLVSEYNSNPVRQWDQQQKGYPFQIDQVMLNGQRFFEYIQHYTHLYQKLFVQDEGHEALKKVRDIINNYDGNQRIGDHYVRILYECAVMYYYDKFAEYELERAAWLCFRWSFQIRLQYHRVAMTTIDNIARKNSSLIRAIKRALQPQDVFSHLVPRPPKLKADRKDIKETNLLNALCPEGES